MTSFQTDILSEMKQLNDEIVAAHNKHYEASPTGLLNPKESPNGNTMYHLYSDGEITYQKGGWAYLQRSVFTSFSKVNNMVHLGFKFPKTKENVKESYAILLEEECYEFREKMISLIKKL
jgi:hypothetical protein